MTSSPGFFPLSSFPGGAPGFLSKNTLHSYFITFGSFSLHFFFLGELTWDDLASLEVQIETFYLVGIKCFRGVILFNIYNRLIIHTILDFQASGNE